MVYGLDVDEVTFFNSALQPAKLAFFTDANSAHKAAARKRSATVLAVPGKSPKYKINLFQNAKIINTNTFF